MKSIKVNGRFVHYQQTGVQRYLNEILAHTGDDLDAIVPSRPLEGIPAHLWEQTVLRFRCRPEMLWTPTCSGPFGYRPMVVTVHDLAPLEHPEWFSGKYTAWYSRAMPILARQARYLIAVSEFTAGRLVELLTIPRERITVVHNGVTDRFRPRTDDEYTRTLESYDLEPESYVLTVGTLEPRKNLRRLVRAWNRLDEGGEVDSVDLVIAGAEPSGDVFDVTGTEADHAEVRKLGYVPDADLPALYSGAIAFAYPSLYEGFGLPVLEAMACGTPVVCSSRGALPEVAGDAALAFDPERPVEIAGALRRVLTDRELRESLSDNGRARSSEFSWASTASETVDVLRSVREGLEQ